MDTKRALTTMVEVITEEGAGITTESLLVDPVTMPHTVAIKEVADLGLAALEGTKSLDLTLDLTSTEEAVISTLQATEVEVTTIIATMDPVTETTTIEIPGTTETQALGTTSQEETGPGLEAEAMTPEEKGTVIKREAATEETAGQYQGHQRWIATML